MAANSSQATNIEQLDCYYFSDQFDFALPDVINIDDNKLKNAITLAREGKMKCHSNPESGIRKLNAALHAISS